MVYIIAEVGPNHNGSLDIALEMIEELSNCGVDAVKFQLSNPEFVLSQNAFKAAYQEVDGNNESHLEMSQRHQLPADAHGHLNKACADREVDYLCTAFDLKSLEYLERNFRLPYFKIASGEIHAIDMLDFISRTDRPVILSTGMAEFDEIGASIKILEQHGTKEISILHCVSNYPTPPEDVHLQVMMELAERFQRPVGFSDHTLGNECAIAAVAMGAEIIEKHVTLDRSMPGPDHKASATIEEFSNLVRDIRNVEKALGGREKVFSSNEANVRDVARKSIVTRRDLPKGHTIAADDICFKRPGTGISPLRRDEIVGRKLAGPIPADHLVLEEHLT